jgi:hypothetical protein
MILRLWTEPGGDTRVRVTRTSDIESGQSTTTYASDRAEVVALVEAWLDESSVPAVPAPRKP